MTKMKWAAILMITFFSQSCQQKEILTREEVIAAIQRFDQGWKNKNPAEVDTVLSPSYVYFTQSGGTFDRKNIIYTAGSSDYITIIKNKGKVEILSEHCTLIK